MATSHIPVTEGDGGKKVASHSISEDSVTKEIQRVNLNDSAGVDVLGTKADAKNTATDTTAVSAVSIWKQISQSVQDAADALVTTIATTLSSILTAVQNNHTIVNGAETAVTVPASGYTTLTTITNTRHKTLVFQFDVATQALDQFQILGKAHASATAQTFGADANSWTDPDAVDSNIAPGSRILETNGDLGAVAAAGNGYFAMDITGLVEIVVQASAAVNNASVTPRWSLHP